MNNDIPEQQYMSVKIPEEHATRKPRKRFAITIMGTAEYEAGGSSQNFESFYKKHKKTIENALNEDRKGISVKSVLRHFCLDDAIGQVQES